MLIIAQAAIDDAQSKVQWLVIGLIAIAVLLGALTIWYWRYTDPTRRLNRQGKAGAPAQPASSGEPVRASMPTDASQSAPSTAAAARPAEPIPAGTKPADMAVPTVGVAVDHDDDDDWLSLTGPQALPRTAAEQE